jgi:hypothetical protein
MRALRRRGGLARRALDDLAADRRAEAVGDRHHQLARIETHVIGLEMAAEAARQPAGELDHAGAGLAAAHGGENRTELHGVALQKAAQSCLSQAAQPRPLIEVDQSIEAAAYGNLLMVCRGFCI